MGLLAVAIREATEPDLDHPHLCGPNGDYRPGLAEALGQGDLILVAESSGEIVGRLTVHWRQAAAELSGLVVVEARWGVGIGSALLAAAEETAQQRAVSIMRLTVGQRNRRAIKFYQRRGYGILSQGLSDGLVAADGVVVHQPEPVWAMGKDLASKALRR